MSTWTLTPDWSKPLLNHNQRMHWRVSAPIKASVRQTAALLAKSAKVPALRHATVHMVWTVPDRTRRDGPNALATQKPFVDGLVDAGVVPDDTAEFVTELIPTIEYIKGSRAVRFEISGESM